MVTTSATGEFLGQIPIFSILTRIPSATLTAYSELVSGRIETNSSPPYRAREFRKKHPPLLD